VSDEQKAEAAKRNRRAPTVPKTLTLGECIQCGKPVVVALQKGVPLAYYEDETFCSATCARDHHGVERPPSLHAGTKKAF